MTTGDGPVKPFLKWAGGKRGLLPQMLPHVPTEFGSYHEPFVGSGALFFHLGARKAWLTDTNERLIRCYCGLRDATDEVVELLSGYRYEREFFLDMRSRPIDDETDAVLAAWFIYLNKTGFNGLYRVNSKNEFNVPFGKYKNPKICDERTLRACAARLRKAKIRHEDFGGVKRRAKAGDLVYFDPPYVPLSATSSFTSYTKDGFGLDSQERLAECARALVQRGVHVLVSNSSVDAVRELYDAPEFELVEILARRAINSRTDRRGKVPELLIKGRRP